MQRNTSFSASPEFVVPRPPSPFHFNSDDYESQVPEEWYRKRAMGSANFPVECTQTDVSILLISPSLSTFYWTGYQQSIS